ncbi:unnamed protein product, partial [Ectocarpus sp. 12 AP-2014]
GFCFRSCEGSCRQHRRGKQASDCRTRGLDDIPSRSIQPCSRRGCRHLRDSINLLLPKRSCTGDGAAGEGITTCSSRQCDARNKSKLHGVVLLPRHVLWRMNDGVAG